MRWLRHLFAPSARHLFTPARMEAIAAAITAGEKIHSGEVMFAVEADLPLTALWRGVSPRARAEYAFTHLRTWDTRANNGVLIYLLLADHAIEIVADRGLHDKVLPAQWQQVCQTMEQRLRGGDGEAAVLAGVAAVSALLAEHFPAAAGDAGEDELPNRPQLLG
jgi:uncharacterized membrane protein